MSVNQKKNHKKSSQSRLVIILGIMLVVLIVLGFFWHKSASSPQASATASQAPTIASVPGDPNASDKYVGDQKDQNNSEAEAAAKSAGSSVPTIVRPGFVGNPADFIDLPTDKPAVDATDDKPASCSIKKTVVMFKPNPSSCTAENLALAKKTGVTAEELLCQGCACPALKLAGYTIGDLKNIGLTAAQLKKCGFSLNDLIKAGFSAADLKDAGFTAKELADAGMSASQLKDAGFSAKDLADAGFSPEDLKKAGYSAKALKDAGFSAAQLKAAGFSAKQMSDAGYSPEDLKDAGFSDAAIEKANASNANCNVSALKKARDNGESAVSLRNKGCSLAALKAAGFSAKELKDAGYSAAELKDAGFSAKQLSDAGYSPKDLKDAGFSAAQLKKAGLSADQLKDAGYTAGDLASAGYSAKDIAHAGYSPKDLHDAGLTAADLKDAGYSAGDVADAGYSSGDMLRAGFTPEQSGYSAPKPDTVTPSPTVNTTSQAQSNPLSAKQIPDVDSSNDDLQSQLAALNKQQQERMNDQQRQQELAQMEANMAVQSQSLMTAWGQHAGQALTAAPVDNTDANGNAMPTTDSSVNGKVYKAGTVLFAVLDTSINSDETSPIMASIVSGPLKGGKLLGKFTREDKKLLISFTLLNEPSLTKSISFNGVAIDADTARTALSGEVDNHYLLRYGSLFAASFLQGMGTAYQSFQSSASAINIGNTYSDNPPNATQVTLQGLGQVGESMGDNMQSTFRMPPTIKIDAGTGIGVLLMSDLTVPYGDNAGQATIGGSSADQSAAPDNTATKSS